MIKKKKELSDQQKKEKLRKKCVKLAKDIAKEVAGWRCEYDGEGIRCPSSKLNGKQMHGSHIYGENTHKAMSADPDNILCLCAAHHIGGYWKNLNQLCWHENPVEMADWFRKKYPQRYQELKERTWKSPTCTIQFWEEKEKSLKEIFNSLPE
jgi:hypothetical protein